MLEAFLVPEKTVVRAKGDSSAVEIDAAASRAFLLTLSIGSVVEQESIEVSVFTSSDGNLGLQACRCPAAEVLRGGVSAVGRPVGDARGKVHSRPLGRQSVGPRHSDSAV